jgi:5-formyltetrahydrofolate cyclo-ligase
MDVVAAKRILRASARATRTSASVAQPDAPASVAGHVRILAKSMRTTGIASGYIPVRCEIDPLPAMCALAALGWTLSLPVVAGVDQPLIFRAWTVGAPTVSAAFGLETPADETEVVPALLLVPMLAFDQRGHRLGYGGGYYDRTIAALRARGRDVLAVGVAFSAQEVAMLPVGETDMRLDAIATEAGLFWPVG